MPITQANDTEIDPVSCLLYPVNSSEPVFTCGNQEGYWCIKIPIIAVRLSFFGVWVQQP